MPEIKYLPEQRRFQIDIDGLEAGYIGYTEENGGWNVVHTEVSPQGVKGRLKNTFQTAFDVCRHKTAAYRYGI